MKSPLPIILALLACLACAAGGYFAGHLTSSGSGSAAAKSATDGTKAHSGADTTYAGLGIPAKATWQSLLKGKGKLSPDLLADWAKNLSPEEIAANLQALKDQPANARRNDIMSALYDAWAQRDPKGFLETADTIGVPRLRENGVDAALKSWAMQNPQEALQWIKDNPGTASTAAYQQRYAAAIAGYAATDPQAAIGIVLGLGESTTHDQALKGAAIKAIADTLTDQGEFTDAVKYFGELPPGTTRDDAFAQLAQSWTAASPQDASTWVASLTDPDQRNAMGGKVAKAWAAIDPAAAATWAAQMDQQSASDPNATPAIPGMGSIGGQVLASAIVSWADYDLDGPGKFLNGLDPSPAKDGAVAIFAMHASQEDPQSALNWVNTITNDGMKQGVTMVVAMEWMQQDQAGFNQFLSTTDTISPQTKDMLNSIPPQAIQGLGMMSKMMGEDFMQKMLETVITNPAAFGGLRGLGGPGTSVRVNQPPPDAIPDAAPAP